MIEVIMIVFLLLALGILTVKYHKLEDRLTIQKTENKNLRRVLYENDLIPEKFVK